MNQIPRPEYPRPDFQRENWLPLNGEWDFSFDEPIFDWKILVPFACETKAFRHSRHQLSQCCLVSPQLFTAGADA